MHVLYVWGAAKYYNDRHTYKIMLYTVHNGYRFQKDLAYFINNPYMTSASAAVSLERINFRCMWCWKLNDVCAVRILFGVVLQNTKLHHANNLFFTDKVVIFTALNKIYIFASSARWELCSKFDRDCVRISPKRKMF